MTSCIKSSVSKNHDKNKVSQKTSVHLPELFKNENITVNIRNQAQITNIVIVFEVQYIILSITSIY